LCGAGYSADRSLAGRPAACPSGVSPAQSGRAACPPRSLAIELAMLLLLLLLLLAL